ncbi:MAG TPA: hypothetical protein VKB88_46050 [Bryobacteraceae bacterium]|nr:hypothetical protein [Bryobacteraceae bacterium]
MACPDFETLVSEGSDGHAAHCEHCAALLESLADVDAGLEASFSRTLAPPSLAAAVRLRIAHDGLRRRPSLLPEILDFVGWAAVLALAAVLVERFLPLVDATVARIRL